MGKGNRGEAKASPVFFPASVLIPLGRLLAFVWSVAVGIFRSAANRVRQGTLAAWRRRDPGGSHANGQ